MLVNFIFLKLIKLFNQIFFNEIFMKVILFYFIPIMTLHLIPLDFILLSQQPLSLNIICKYLL